MTEEQRKLLENLDLPEDERRKLLNNNSISQTNLIIPAAYKEAFLPDSKYNRFLFSSGRISGKTSILVAKWWERTNKFRDRDIVILQSTATEIKDSIINEIEKFLTNSGFSVGYGSGVEFYIPKTRDRIQRRGQKGATYIYPITDSKGGQRSRGVNTKNKLSLVLYEEAQKNKDANVVEQSVITFIRQLDDEAQMIIAGNNETAGHWFVDYVAEKRQDPAWCYVYANCYDIWKLLNKDTQDYIESVKKANYTEFRRIFLGDIHANTSNVVFPQFTREKNYKLIKDIPVKTMQYLIIGIDHATANDTFACVPVAILDDWTTQTLEVCYDDPKVTQRTLAPTEQIDILADFLEFLDNKYGIIYNRLPVILSIDGQAATFREQLEHEKATTLNKRLWKNIKIKGFTKKKKQQDIDVIRNAFAYNVLTILNEGAYDWKHERNYHRLAKEIEMQRFKNGALDPHIPNDFCDALEYGLVPFYSNCYNLSFPMRNRDKSHYDDIRKTARLVK